MSARLEHAISLVDRLLAEQRQLDSAVSRFSRWHDRESADSPPPPYYRDLIPSRRPGQGEQYAFEVNLDQCTGCKACVAACHSLNGLDDDESWRQAGVLIGGGTAAYQQTITSACHHCADPACANGCPVLAYDKDPSTGIVRHLDDQCIGCSYCQMKCPYDVPKFNRSRGIVRKCDMCQSRLAAGEAPACVQACPTGAIAIRVVRVDPEPDSPLLPGLVDSRYTRPATRYVTARPVPAGARPAGDPTPRVEATHAPLAVMLVLTQLATGALSWSRGPLMNGVAFAAAMIGILSSVAHLGQPSKAWRSFLGWRRSWLSREILAFGAFAPLAFLAAMNCISAAAAAAAGWVSVFCSVMVYADTRRPAWALSRTLPRFAGTSLVLGAALAACCDAALARPAALLALAKLAWEAAILFSRSPSCAPSRSLQLGILRPWIIARFVAGALGAALTFAAPLGGFAAILLGEITERLVFFKAGVAWKMPGEG